MDRKYRNELKFLCTEKDLYLIETKIRHICRPDPHVGETGVYSVTSLYFDTYDDRCYHENLAGTDHRKKYRIRTYNNDTDVIKLECKYSCHGKKAKESCNITRQQYEILAGRRFSGINLPQACAAGGCGQQLMQRFLLEKALSLLEPRIIVDYRRTPYIFPAGNVRITFDRCIRSSHQTERFFAPSAAFRSILPEDMHILEVKYDEYIPASILELTAVGRQLDRTSFSKYVLCRQYGTR